MLLHAATIFCGAFLVFLVQPLMGKYLLPWFGGGPGVWTTCLLFFQSMLLAGYAYAHWLTQKLTPRRQALVHALLLVVALALLPVIPNPGWKDAGTAQPILRILWLLTVTLGVPYLALAATGPLVQWWFSLSHPGVPPYRLYALSNVGSLLALVAYPFVFEPHFTRREMSLGWSAGLALFALLCGACAWRVRHRPAAPAAAATTGEPASTPTRLDRLLWALFPAIASLLLAATTNKLCLDVAAIPFLWILPLGVYLLTFIVCFDHPRWYQRGFFCGLLALMCCILAFFLSVATPPMYQQIAVLLGTLFAAGMVCHGELYRLRPGPRHLTSYYLVIAASGAAGTLFVSLAAPLLFSDFRELQLGLVLLLYVLGVACYLQRSRAIAWGLAAGVLAVAIVMPALRADTRGTAFSWVWSFLREGRHFLVQQWIVAVSVGVVLVFVFRDGWRVARQWRRRLVVVPALLTVLLAVVFVRQAQTDGSTVAEAGRNFYGAYKVHLYNDSPDPNAHFLILANGDITHGQQFWAGPQSLWPTTYYSETSGLGRALSALPGGPRRIGAVGLGAGTVAVYGRPGDTIRFYEINPAIAAVATHRFSFLRNCRAEVSIALGDARLVLEQELAGGVRQRFDLLVLDAFAGDAIPIHLLTHEAMEVYRQHLRPGGIIAVHISNRHLDLRPAVEGLARDAAMAFATVSDTVDPASWWLYNTVWVLLSSDPAVLAHEAIARHAQEPPDATARTVLWTDDHASLVDVLR